MSVASSGAELARRPAHLREIAPTGDDGWNRASELATQAGTISTVAREEAELKGALILARNFPRDEANCYARMMRSCGRAAFAESAAYSFPRGGSNVTGPSVDLAREAARLWGNLRYGLRLVSVDDDYVHIKGYAFDLETNTMTEAEDKFRKLVQRKVGPREARRTEWVEPDERDLRELVNRRGAICVRNAILQLIPPDVVDDAMRACDETMKKAAKGDLTQDRTQAIRRIAVAFDKLGVNTDMLVAKLGCALDAISDDQLVELRKIYKSLLDGNTRRDDHFAPAVQPPQSNAGVAAARERVVGAAAKPPTTEQTTPGAAASAPVANPAPAKQAEPSPARDGAPPLLEQVAIEASEQWGVEVAEATKRLDSFCLNLHRKPLTGMTKEGLAGLRKKIESGELPFRPAAS